MPTRLTGLQIHVLAVLSNRGECARNDWAAWYPFDSSQIYGVIERLGRKGFVDVAGFTHSDRASRTFKITAAGAAALDEIPEEDRGIEE